MNEGTPPISSHRTNSATVTLHIADHGEHRHRDYTDYGPTLERSTVGTASGKLTVTRRSHRFDSRPFCDLCGPFRSRYLRCIGSDDIGPEYRCSDCDVLD